MKSQKGVNQNVAPLPFLIQANVVLKNQHLPSQSGISASTGSIKCTTLKNKPNHKSVLKPPGFSTPKNPTFFPYLAHPTQEPSTHESQPTTNQIDDERTSVIGKKTKKLRRRRQHCSRLWERGNAAVTPRSRAYAVAHLRTMVEGFVGFLGANQGRERGDR